MEACIVTSRLKMKCSNMCSTNPESASQGGYMPRREKQNRWGYMERPIFNQKDVDTFVILFAILFSLPWFLYEFWERWKLESSYWSLTQIIQQRGYGGGSTPVMAALHEWCNEKEGCGSWVRFEDVGISLAKFELFLPSFEHIDH